MSNDTSGSIEQHSRRRAIKKHIGIKQWLLGACMVLVLTVILSVNLLPPDYLARPFDMQRALGMFLLALGIVTVSGLYLYDYRPYAFSKPSLLFLLGATFIGFTTIAKALSVLALSNAAYWGYLIPVAYIAMLMTLLFDPHLAIMIVISASIMIGAVTEFNFSYMITALLGGMIAVYTATDMTERTELTKAGLITGLGIAFFTVTAGFIRGSTATLFANGVVGFMNGLLSAVLALGTLPLLERRFGILTPMRLLELSNPNQPLLRRLMTEAPGTYSHSINVGNLAEAAADAAGADPLLVRVGAYYHDIGKLKRPTFFVENQSTGDSKHEKINPQLSCLVITSHVKEGLDLGREANLPQPILDLIDQHHGKGLVTFFYHQAKQQGLKEDVCDDSYRYSGEKPQSREAAILMLADAMEAAAKTVKAPSLTRFETLSKKIIQERMDDGQLDESDLTLAELNKVAKSFTHTLAGVYHKRVAYPEMKNEDMKQRRKGIYRAG